MSNNSDLESKYKNLSVDEMRDLLENDNSLSDEEEDYLSEKVTEAEIEEESNKHKNGNQLTLSQLEELRIKVKRQITTILVICLSLFVIFMVITNGAALYSLVFLIIIMAILLVFVPAKNKKEFNDAYKRLFVRRSFEGLFTDLKYAPEQGISSYTISNTGMMSTGDVFSSNDYIEGKYKGILFKQSDVHIEEESTDSEGHTTYTTIFQGRWMIFDFNKPFKANIEVAQKWFGANTLKHYKNKEERFKRVKLESEEFNKRFKVYAQSELEAFYILTPHMIERIMKLDDQNSGKLLLCFVDNQLHVGVYDGKDSFEYSNYFKKIDEQTELEKISRDIKLITMFIDELSLDNDLFRKEV